MLNGYKTYISAGLTLAIGIAAVFGITPLEQAPAWMEALLMLTGTAATMLARRHRDTREQP